MPKKIKKTIISLIIVITKLATKRLRNLRSLLSWSFLNFQQKPVAVPNIYLQLHDRPRWKEKENRE